MLSIQSVSAKSQLAVDVDASSPYMKLSRLILNIFSFIHLSGHEAMNGRLTKRQGCPYRMYSIPVL